MRALPKLTAKPLALGRYLLGESPVYQGDCQILSWVDIDSGALYWVSPGQPVQSMQMNQYLSAAIPTVSGKYVCAMTTGIYIVSSKGIKRKLDAPEGLLLSHRFNDAKCDSSGRLWAGTMPLLGDNRDCRLYCIDGSGKCTSALTGIGISNGIAWSPKNDVMYYIDSATRCVDRIVFFQESGTLGTRNSAFYIDDGVPDGMCVDWEGMLWVVVWGSGQVRRYDPSNGKVLAVVQLPVRYPTSCCFGGNDLDQLYITTAMNGEMENPLAGTLFCVQTDVSGIQMCLFDDSVIESVE